MNEERTELEAAVLKLVSGPKYQPVKPGVIAKKLKLPKEQLRDVKKVIKRLVKKGVLSWGSSHLVRLPDKAKSVKSSDRHVIGLFRRASGGFGFVHPSSAGSHSRDEDIFIPPRKMLDASHGDLVEVRLSKSRDPKADSKRSGTIVEVIERETHQFVGTYSEQAGDGFVRIDGTVFAQPVYVGDAGAKSAKVGEKVVIEMVRFPSHVHEGEGVIVEVLGKRGKPGVDTLTVMREFQLPESFPEEVLENAREIAEQFDESTLGSRRDLTDLTIITIDPVDARDFDDAISLERIENDHWRLGVHIADVSHFVRPKTMLDDEAYKRATSVYLPDRVIPMLPEIISNNLASLQPKRVRFTKTVFIEFTPDGAPVHAEFCSAAIKSRHRFTYEEVDEYLADPDPWKKKLKVDVFKLLGRMHGLAMILRNRRLSAGSLELTLPEVKIDLDSKGRVSGAHVVENTESHQVIEEFMLAANEEVAQMLHRRDLFFLRRVHEPPNRRKLSDLTRFVRGLGIHCGSLENRFEIKRVLDEIADKPESYAVNYAVLRSMTKAAYSPVEEAHYALNSQHYCHFTSPIRRYPDLVVHRMLETLENRKRPPQDFSAMSVVGQHCSDREQRAEKAERELTKVKLLNFLGKRIGEQMDAVVTGVEEYGLFAQGVKIPAEGRIHVNTMQDDFYEFDRKSHSLSGRRAGNQFRLGDLIRVEIVRVDADRRELDYRLVQSSRKRKAAKIAGKPRRKKKKAVKKRRPSARTKKRRK